MGNPLKTFILVTGKPWHDQLFHELKALTGQQWIRITEKDEFKYENIARISPDMIFIPHWSHIIPAEIYDRFECIVFHMTDLPFGRGGSPLQNLIVRGFERTVISAIKVTAGIDTGAIYLKQPLSLMGSATEIFQRSSDIIRRMIIEIVENDLPPVPQQGDPVVFKRRTPSESDISGLAEIKRLYDYIRMLDCEGYPHAYLETAGFRFEFTGATLHPDQTITANVRIFKK